MDSYRHPDARWHGTPNFTPDRGGHSMAIEPAYVVLHTMVTTVAGADARFQQPSEQASATYGVGLDGSLHQWVDEKDAAWANGATGRGGRGDNLDSISIEHEDAGDYDGPRTPGLYNASARLVREICQRYGLPIDRDHVIAHHECAFASTGCPDALDVDWIVRAAARGVFDRGGSAVEDAVVPAQPVPGRIWRNATIYDWSTLAPLGTTDQRGQTGMTVHWTEARKVGGVWYDRVAPGAWPAGWALDDGDVDDTAPGDGAGPAGWDPTHFRPPAPRP